VTLPRPVAHAAIAGAILAGIWIGNALFRMFSGG
jgi:hypothetical protein